MPDIMCVSGAFSPTAGDGGAVCEAWLIALVSISKKPVVNASSISIRMVLLGERPSRTQMLGILLTPAAATLLGAVS